MADLLGHNSLAITADTYTSVLPEVAMTAAEAVAEIIPRQIQNVQQDPPQQRG
jgi:hypothetical protein